MSGDWWPVGKRLDEILITGELAVGVEYIE